MRAVMVTFGHAAFMRRMLPSSNPSSCVISVQPAAEPCQSLKTNLSHLGCTLLLPHVRKCEEQHLRVKTWHHQVMAPATSDGLIIKNCNIGSILFSIILFPSRSSCSEGFAVSLFTPLGDIYGSSAPQRQLGLQLLE